MTNSFIPVAMQQNTDPVIIQIENEDDVLSQVPEVTHNDEGISTMNNLEIPSTKEITDPSKFEIEPSFMDACGSDLEP